MTGLELEASKNLTALIIKVLWEQGGKFLKTLDKQTQRLIFSASQQYIQKYTERHGKLKVLGMREPVALESVYTAVQFLDEVTTSEFESIVWFEENYRQNKSRGFQIRTNKKKEGMETANEKQYLMVLGEPGTGKTTFLRKIGLESLKSKNGKFQHECIPIFIELKGLSDDIVSIKDLVIEEFRTCSFPYPEESVMELLERGKLLILIDALDEIPVKIVNQAVGQIQRFVDQYSKNRFVVSCRSVAYHGDFSRFSDVLMAEFDDFQIEQFIFNWFSSALDRQQGTDRKCWEILNKPENIAAKELAHTPLLLTFLCLVYDRAQRFPDNRSILYNKALRILLEEWSAEKRIMRDEIYQGMNIELETLLLAKIAHSNFEIDQLFFSKREVVIEIKTFLASNLNAPKNLDGEAVLQAIAVQQGILVKRAEDVFSFSHLTLQEYLTAYYIDDQSQVDELVAAHLKNQRWKEIFLLVAGLVRGGADELLLKMEKQAQDYINTPKLRTLLAWINQITSGSQDKFKPAAKRLFAIFLVLILDLSRVLTINPDRALTLALDMAIAQNFTLGPRAEAHAYLISLAYTFNLDFLCLNQAATLKLASGFEKLEILKDVNFALLISKLKALELRVPDEQQPLEVHRTFRAHVLHTWFSTLRLNPELSRLSDEEIEALRNYLYVYLLIVQCKKAAIRVSPQVWESIENRLLSIFS